MVIKLNKGIKKDLAIVIAKHFTSVKEVKVNQLKKEILTFIEPLKTLNKKNALVIQRMLPKEHRSKVVEAIEAFGKVMEMKPKRMLSQYMNFSCEKSKVKEFAALDFKERGKRIAAEWKKVSVKRKANYNAPKNVSDQYSLDNQAFKTKLKALKALKF